MFLFLFLGLPVAFVMGGVAAVFCILFWGVDGLFILVARALGMMRSEVMIAGPLFVLMGTLLEASGIAEDMYEAMYRWSGRLKGGLATGTVVICTVMAAMTGIAATGVVTMGLIALPSMLKRGYHKTIALGSVLAGGTLGPLIPPSLVLIVYGLMFHVSVGALFAGALFPGLLLSILFIIYISIRCHLNPSDGPSLPDEELYDWKAKLVSLKAVILPVLLIVLVLGSIYGGVATPTEAAAVGAFGVLGCVAARRRLNLDLMKKSALTTTKIVGMIMWILVSAQMFVAIYTGIGAPRLMADLIAAHPVSPFTMLIIIQVIWFLLGFMMDALSILALTGPLIFPILIHFDLCPLWFGILYGVNTQTSYKTPPFGTMLFVIRGIVPAGVTTEDIYRSVVPFVILQLIGLAIVIAFPPIALWLPNLLF
jgi:tripartite ATP-independent transporter DctM subunit